MGSAGGYQGTGVFLGEGAGHYEPAGRITLHPSTAGSGKGHLSIAWDAHDTVIFSSLIKINLRFFVKEEARKLLKVNFLWAAKSDPQKLEDAS